MSRDVFKTAGLLAELAELTELCTTTLPQINQVELEDVGHKDEFTQPTEAPQRPNSRERLGGLYL